MSNNYSIWILSIFVGIWKMKTNVKWSEQNYQIDEKYITIVLSEEISLRKDN